MGGKNLSFGMLSSAYNITWPQMLAIWKEAEKLGYESGWLSDHLMSIAGSPDSSCLESLTTLAVLSRETTMRVGPLVLGNSFRNPALVAKMVATLDILSGGRVELGIGAGWAEAEYRAYGYPYPKPAIRIGQLDEAVQVIKLLWSEKAASFEGKYFQLKDAYCEPKPLQQPRPPIWVGGGGEQLTLRVVARHADGWNAFLVSLDDFKRKLGILAEHCQAVGRDPATIRKSLGIIPLVSHDEGKVAAAVERIPAGQRRGLIAGTPEACAAQLRPFVDLGVDLIIVVMRTPHDYESLRLFAEEVIPLLKG